MRMPISLFKPLWSRIQKQYLRFNHQKILLYPLLGAWSGFVAWLVIAMGLNQTQATSSLLINMFTSGIKAGIVGGLLAGGLIFAEWFATKRPWAALLKKGVLQRLFFSLWAPAVLMALMEVPQYIWGSGIRSIAWTLFGCILASGERFGWTANKPIFWSLLAGASGGFIGGSLFDILALNLHMAVAQSVALIILCVMLAFTLIFMNEVTKEAVILYRNTEFQLTANSLIGKNDAHAVFIWGDTIAPTHAQIQRAPNGYTITALAPVHVNQQPLAHGHSRLLKHKDIIRLGEVDTIFLEVKGVK